MRYEATDYGNPTLNILAFVGLCIVGILVYKNVKRPWLNIIGVICVWTPLVILQFVNGREVIGIILIVIAGIILKSCWNDN